MQVESPLTGEIISTLPMSSKKDLDDESEEVLAEKMKKLLEDNKLFIEDEKEDKKNKNN